MSHRTLEKWPLSWRRINGRATAPVAEFIAEAERRLEDAAETRGGKQGATPTTNRPPVTA